MFKKTLVAGIIGLGLLTSSPAWAQEAPNCVPMNVVAEALGKTYGETLAGEGADPGHILQLYVNPKTRSFSVIVILPSGLACMGPSGDSWESVEPKEYIPETGS